MHQPIAGCADLTDLECMATIPLRNSSPVEATVKAEAILANLQQRFKKDQIYVSHVLLENAHDERESRRQAFFIFLAKQLREKKCYCLARTRKCFFKDEGTRSFF